MGLPQEGRYATAIRYLGLPGVGGPGDFSPGRDHVLAAVGRAGAAVWAPFLGWAPRLRAAPVGVAAALVVIWFARVLNPGPPRWREGGDLRKMALPRPRLAEARVYFLGGSEQGRADQRRALLVERLGGAHLVDLAEKPTPYAVCSSSQRHQRECGSLRAQRSRSSYERQYCISTGPSCVIRGRLSRSPSSRAASISRNISSSMPASSYNRWPSGLESLRADEGQAQVRILPERGHHGNARLPPHLLFHLALCFPHDAAVQRRPVLTEHR